MRLFLQDSETMPNAAAGNTQETLLSINKMFFLKKKHFVDVFCSSN
jgi:hypothetical protein